MQRRRTSAEIGAHAATTVYTSCSWQHHGQEFSLGAKLAATIGACCRLMLAVAGMHCCMWVGINPTPINDINVMYGHKCATSISMVATDHEYRVPSMLQATHLGFSLDSVKKPLRLFSCRLLMPQLYHFPVCCVLRALMDTAVTSTAGAQPQQQALHSSSAHKHAHVMAAGDCIGQKPCYLNARAMGTSLGDLNSCWQGWPSLIGSYITALAAVGPRKADSDWHHDQSLQSEAAALTACQTLPRQCHGFPASYESIWIRLRTCPSVCSTACMLARQAFWTESSAATAPV